MTDTDRLAALPCNFVPANEPWSCTVHPGGYRTNLAETVCRAAQADAIEPLAAEEVAEFDRWAESRRGKGASLGMLWALRLRATLTAGVRVGDDGLRAALEPFVRAALGSRPAWHGDRRVYHLQIDERTVEQARAALAAPPSPPALDRERLARALVKAQAWNVHLVGAAAAAIADAYEADDA